MEFYVSLGFSVIWNGLNYQQADSHQVEIIKPKQQLSTVCCQETRKMLDVGGPAEICLMSCVFNGFINNLGDLSALTLNSKLLSAANPSEDNL